MATREELQKQIDTLEDSLLTVRGREDAGGPKGLEIREKIDALYRELIPVIQAALDAKQKQYDGSESSSERASLRGDIRSITRYRDKANKNFTASSDKLQDLQKSVGDYQPPILSTFFQEQEQAQKDVQERRRESELARKFRFQSIDDVTDKLSQLFAEKFPEVGEQSLAEKVTLQSAGQPTLDTILHSIAIALVDGKVPSAPSTGISGNLQDILEEFVSGINSGRLSVPIDRDVPTDIEPLPSEQIKLEPISEPPITAPSPAQPTQFGPEQFRQAGVTALPPEVVTDPGVARAMGIAPPSPSDYDMFNELSIDFTGYPENRADLLEAVGYIAVTFGTLSPELREDPDAINMAWEEIRSDMASMGMDLFDQKNWTFFLSDGGDGLIRFLDYHYDIDGKGRDNTEFGALLAEANEKNTFSYDDESYGAVGAALSPEYGKIGYSNLRTGSPTDKGNEALILKELKRALSAVDTSMLSPDDLTLFLDTLWNKAWTAINNATIPIGVNQIDAEWGLVDKEIAAAVTTATRIGVDQMVRNMKLATPSDANGNNPVRQAEIIKIARELGFDIGSGMNAMDLQSFNMALGEIDRRIILDGPDVDMESIINSVLGSPDGDPMRGSFLTQYGMAAPPSAPIMGGQQAYRDLIASGDYTADDIMNTVYGLLDIPGQPKLDMAKADPTGMMSNPKSRTTIQGFIAGGDTVGLTDYLTSLGTYDFSPTGPTGPTGLSLENQYQEGFISPEEYEFLGSLFKQTEDIAAVHAQYGVPIGGDPYKGIYNPYAPPEEIDSRLYAPAAPNIGVGDLPIEGDPGTVRYDVEGRPLGRLYSDIIGEETANLETVHKQIADRAAQLGINPDEYTPGDDLDLDTAFTAFDASAATKFQAEEGLAEARASIAMDESGAKAPHEVDDIPPPPAPDAPRFTTRRRGGRSGF